MRGFTRWLGLVLSVVALSADTTVGVPLTVVAMTSIERAARSSKPVRPKEGESRTVDAEVRWTTGKDDDPARLG